MSPNLQTLLAGVTVFTGFVLLLSSLVLGLRRLLAGSGTLKVLVNGQRTLEAPAGARLLAVLNEGGIHLPAACGARGACGQCRVDIEKGAPPLTAVEAAHVTRRDAQAGTRLACMVALRESLSIALPQHLLEVEHWPCTVESIRQVTTLMKEIVLKMPAGRRIEFEAGQYVLVDAPAHRVAFADFDIPPAFRAEWARHGLLKHVSECGEITQRAYSLANPPADCERVVLTVRIALPPADAPHGTPPGCCSSWLFSLAPGDAVTVSGPYGDFHVHESDREMVLIAGGAGVAPMRAIIFDQLESRKTGRRISFWYGARNLRELCYADEWERLAREYPNFRWQAAMSEPEPGDGWRGPTGFVHSVVKAQYLDGHPAPEEAEYYLCGPPLMNLAVLQMLEDLGVDRRSVFLDDFGSTT